LYKETFAAMNETISTVGLGALGLNLKAIIFQIINFTILVLVLRWLAYKPILLMLEKRRQKIEEGLKTAQQMDKERKEWEQKIAEMTEENREKAQVILQNTQKEAKKEFEAIIARARKQQQEIMEKTRLQVEKEKEEMVQEAKEEIGQLALLLAEKIIQEKLNPQKDQKMIQAALRTLEKGEKQ